LDDADPVFDSDEHNHLEEGEDDFGNQTLRQDFMIFSSHKEEPAIKSPQSLPPSTGLSVKQSTEKLLHSGHNNEVAVLLEEHKVLRRQMRGILEAKP
jgi:hypothetical protein